MKFYLAVNFPVMPSHRGLTATKNQSLTSVPSRHRGLAATKNKSLTSVSSRHHRIFYSKKIFVRANVILPS
jgi:hypothetical protein